MILQVLLMDQTSLTTSGVRSIYPGQSCYLYTWVLYMFGGTGNSNSCGRTFERGSLNKGTTIRQNGEGPTVGTPKRWSIPTFGDDQDWWQRKPKKHVSPWSKFLVFRDPWKYICFIPLQTGWLQGCVAPKNWWCPKNPPWEIFNVGCRDAERGDKVERSDLRGNVPSLQLGFAEVTLVGKNDKHLPQMVVKNGDEW